MQERPAALTRDDGSLAEEASPLEESGERFHPGTGTPENAYEHWHRYLWARELCRGKRVLDVASGEGYGSFLLAGVARSVVGVDLSAPAVEHARQRYPAENLEFLVGRAEALPDQPPASFDVVVSFETIEHLGEAAQGRFLDEVRRVLAPGGLFVVSTPDKENYAGELHEENEFHEREFTADEFRASRVFGGASGWILIPLSRRRAPRASAQGFPGSHGPWQPLVNDDRLRPG